jgi:hypothetical protein
LIKSKLCLEIVTPDSHHAMMMIITPTSPRPEALA